jgi:hypothetical protein
VRLEKYAARKMFLKKDAGRDYSTSKFKRQNDSTLCAFGLIFAPLREMVFLAEAQRKNIRRKELSSTVPFIISASA